MPTQHHGPDARHRETAPPSGTGRARRPASPLLARAARQLMTTVLVTGIFAASAISVDKAGADQAAPLSLAQMARPSATADAGPTPAPAR